MVVLSFLYAVFGLRKLNLRKRCLLALNMADSTPNVKICGQQHRTFSTGTYNLRLTL